MRNKPRMRQILCIALAIIVTATGFGLTPIHAATTKSITPDKVDYGTLKWHLKLGTDYTNAPTPPLVHGNDVYIGMGKTLYKYNKETLTAEGSVTLQNKFAFPTAALSYATLPDGTNVIFTASDAGTVQAIDADTMRSLWVTQTAWSTQLEPNLSCLSKVVYDNGYIYFGTWETNRTPGYFYCYSTTDQSTSTTTEIKKPIWMVKHNGGFYWSEASVAGDYVLFGSEDGISDYNTPSNTATIYSCLKGAAFVAAGKSFGDIPYVDQALVSGDIRSGVAYDTVTQAFYFTSRPGYLYKRKIGADGKFAAASLSQSQLTLGGMTTGTPTVYKGKIYVGIQGATPFGATGHKIRVIDGKTMTIDSSAATPGFVQSEMMLSTASEGTGTGPLYLYMTYNQLPGGIYMMKITQDSTGKKIIQTTGSGKFFTPPTSMQNYGISTLEVDENGVLYYKNDSCTIMAVKAGYTLEAIATGGGSITKSTSVLTGLDYTFALTPSAGFKIADVKVDAVSQGALTRYPFNNVTAPHKVEGVFIPITTANLTAAASTGYNSIKLSWSKQAGFSGYDIWRSTSSAGTYTKIKRLSASTTTYTNTGLTTGKRYYYKIKGFYTDSNGRNVYSKISSTYKSAIPKLTKPVLSTISGTDKIRLNWKSVAGAQGYKIYRKASATASYIRVKTITPGSTQTWLNEGLITGKTYYYKIVAYRVVNGKTYYSSFSNVSYRKPN